MKHESSILYSAELTLEDEDINNKGFLSLEISGIHDDADPQEYDFSYHHHHQNQELQSAFMDFTNNPNVGNEQTVLQANEEEKIHKRKAGRPSVPKDGCVPETEPGIIENFPEKRKALMRRLTNCVQLKSENELCQPCPGSLIHMTPYEIADLKKTISVFKGATSKQPTVDSTGKELHPVSDIHYQVRHRWSKLAKQRFLKNLSCAYLLVKYAPLVLKEQKGKCVINR